MSRKILMQVMEELREYLWEYRTGKFATGPPVILFLQLDGATGYFEG